MKLIAVTDNKMPTLQLVQTIIAIEPYIDAVILREKSKTDLEIINILQMLTAAQFDQSKIIVHGRADIASLFGIKKVQLPGHGIPLPIIKEHFPSLYFGRSVHSLQEAEIAVKAGADWLIYGHLFETGSKEGLPPRGTDELACMTKSLNIPVYAIGGIKANHVHHLKSFSIAGIAVMSTIFGSNNPANAAKNYLKGARFYE